MPFGQLARKHGISEATLYNWKSKYGGMDVSEAKRLRMLEDENRKLKKLLAESMLDNAALKELNRLRAARRNQVIADGDAVGRHPVGSTSLLRAACDAHDVVRREVIE
jgi:putative transposase